MLGRTVLVLTPFLARECDVVAREFRDGTKDSGSAIG